MESRKPNNQHPTMLCQALEHEYQQLDIAPPVENSSVEGLLRETDESLFRKLKAASRPPVRQAQQSSTEEGKANTPDPDYTHIITLFDEQILQFLRSYELVDGKKLQWQKSEATSSEEAEATSSAESTDASPILLAEVAQGLREELNRIRLAELTRQIGKQQVAALCLSGGGIRSATFALGVIQGLAKNGLLKQFDYLSTVSGGGYIGSWLTAWIHRRGRKEVLGKLNPEIPEQTYFDGSNSESILNLPASLSPPEPRTITHLREYSNYLSPRVGLSTDGFTLIAIYLRNLLLNWLVLLPAVAAILMIPRLGSSFMAKVFVEGQSLFGPMTACWLLGLSGLLGICALTFMGLNRPSMGNSAARQKLYLWLCLLPLVAAALLQAILWAWYIGQNRQFLSFWYFLIAGILFNVGGFFGWAFITLGRAIKNRSAQKKPEKPNGVSGNPPAQSTDTRKPARVRFRELLVILVVGFLTGYLAWLFSSTGIFFEPVETGWIFHVSTYTILGSVILLVVFLISAFLFVGGASFWTRDEDREWWSRSDAWIMIVIVSWVGVSSLVIFGPIALGKITTAIGGVSGLIAVLLGKSASTKGPAAKTTAGLGALLKEKTLTIAATIFFLFFLIVISLATTQFIKLIDDSEFIGQYAPMLKLRPQPAVATENVAETESQTLQELPPWQIVARRSASNSEPVDYFGHREIIYRTPTSLILALMALFAALSSVAASIVNINKFSLNALYRNRLIRAYLGASRGDDRQANPFTGFDPKDNIPMSELKVPEKGQVSDPNDSGKEEKKVQKPFHVINAALNLVQGEKLAWQQRKAESFTISPLYSGNANVGYVNSQDYGGKEGGISLGTAVSISGAAVSPNMGYHSSPVVAFILTLFNVRLGWWLANPKIADPATLNLPGPNFALRPLFSEAFGLTNNKNPYIYLSDGGHFENLGLYEMVLRRCRFILISDGSSDKDYLFDDLGNAIRKIRIDFGIPIKMERMSLFALSSDEKRNALGRYCAVGRIEYSAVDQTSEDEDGYLIYIKPAFYDLEEPRDVINFAKSNPPFPHESTGDQFFSESQFESYRSLGFYAVEQICKDGWNSKNHTGKRLYKAFYEAAKKEATRGAIPMAQP